MPKNRKYLNWLRKKQKQQGSRKPSTGTRKNDSVSYQHQQHSDTPSSFTLHRSIKTLCYESFILIITGEDLGPLIISGQPPVDELVSAWNTIADEYAEAIKTGKSKSVFEAYKKVVRLEAQIKMIDACLYYLTQYYDEEIATILSENGYHFIAPNDDTEVYLREINIVRTQAKTLIVILNQAVAHYRLLSPDNELKFERSYQDFLNELAVLSEHQGYALRPKEITVAEYCAVVNSFIRKVEAYKKKHNG
jgi:hypothetical protein